MRPDVRRAALLSALPLLLGPVASLSALPAAAKAAAVPIADTTPVSVSLALVPASRSLLASAGNARSDVRRLVAARAARPTAAAGDAAVSYLRASGFTVRGQSRWLVSATGTAGAARAAFGAHLVRGADGVRPSRPLDVPRALQGSVSGVIGLDTRSRWRPLAVPGGLTGTDLRAAYQVSKPIGSAVGMTVATAQFGGWIRSDLETYAAATGVAMPSVTVRPVSGVNPKSLDDNGGVEAALDQEALLATAPGAAHVIFFGHNTDAGAVQTYDAIATAAERDEFDVLSLSWGLCELDTTADVMRAVNDSLARVVAAGKTVFAAAGDAGAHDCVDKTTKGKLAVDFPASSPYVVGVGGTQLARRADASWAEVGWNDPTKGARASGGGGFSRVFERPAWQPAETPQDPPGTKSRMVPDIAAVADPRTGVAIFASTEGGWVMGGGTSLAAPLVAGHFASTLATAGKRNGLGRALQPILYANPQAFRDVVEGENFGYTAATGYDLVSGLGTPLWDQLLPLIATGPIVSTPDVSRSLTVPVTIALPGARTYARYRICESNEDAHCETPDLAVDPAGGTLSLQLAPGKSRTTRIIVVGFDAAGLEFPGAAYTTYDATPPTVSAAARLTSPTGTTAKFSWGAVDPAPGGSVARYEVQVTQHGVTKPLKAYSGALTSWSAVLKPGGMYTLAVRASDTVGNVSEWKSAELSVPLDQSQLSLTGRWVTRANRGAYGGSAATASTPGAEATARVRGSSADLLVTAGPTGGLIDVFLGSVLSARIDTYSAVVRPYRFVRVASWPGPAPRLIRMRVVGAVGRSARRSVVTIDGLRVNWN